MSAHKSPPTKSLLYLNPNDPNVHTLHISAAIAKQWLAHPASPETLFFTNGLWTAMDRAQHDLLSEYAKHFTYPHYIVIEITR